MTVLDREEAAANLEQQLEEVAVLQAICGRDFMLLSPLAGASTDDTAIGNRSGSGSNPDGSGGHSGSDCRAGGASHERLGQGPGSEQCVDGVEAEGGDEEAHPDVEALRGGEVLEAQAAVHLQLPPEGLPIQVAARGGEGNVSSPVEAGATEPDATAARAEPDQSKLQHLPPLCLHLRFPPHYPGSGPPEFSVSALWLSGVGAASLAVALQGLWDEQGPGMPICYTWIEWLQSSCLDAIGASCALELARLAAEDGAPGTSSEPGAASSDDEETLADEHHDSLSDSVDMRADHLLMQLMMYDANRGFHIFQSEPHLCPVCYDEKLGTQCLRLDGCRHIFCEECVTTHAQMHVRDGTLQHLKCLDGSCQNALSRQVLERVLGGEGVARMEALELQRALDCMPDVLQCPRCLAVCLEDSDDTHCAQCAKCLYVFCSLCDQSYHPGTRCMSPEAALQLLRERAHGNKNAAAQFFKKEQEIMSLTVIRKTAKQCPSCTMPTQKTEGCNKMTCGNCGVYWCYKCSSTIRGYDHFGSSTCVLFDDEEIARWNAQMAGGGDDGQGRALQRQREQQAELQYWAGQQQGAGGPRRGVHQRVCPVCRARNVKARNNNHITCWSCTSPFCGACQASLRAEGHRHFVGKNKCRQFTRD